MGARTVAGVECPKGLPTAKSVRDGRARLKAHRKLLKARLGGLRGRRRPRACPTPGKTVHLKDGVPTAQVAAGVRYARLMVVRAVVNNRHGQQAHFSNKPTPRPSGCVNTTPLGRTWPTEPGKCQQGAFPFTSRIPPPDSALRTGPSLLASKTGQTREKTSLEQTLTVNFSMAGRTSRLV